MQNIVRSVKNNFLLLLTLVLVVPTFFRMLYPGIHSMQDFHFFRQYEFDKCVKAMQIPCRWAPDAGLGYGEPLFNYYGQFPYFIGEIYYLLSGSIISSVKFLFIWSLIGSAISMFYLARKVWKNDFSALLSTIIYIYAPYRALDVWVRGALPEALAFVLFPLILLSIEKKSVIWFTVLFAILILTHNLSVVMFLPILITWICYRRFWKALYGFIAALLVSAFYILPVIFESKYIDLASTTRGYFDYRAHFVTLSQIFLSRFWGYGGSTWGDGDGLNLSIGQIQWIVPLFIFIVLTYYYIKTKDKKIIIRNTPFMILFLVGIFYIFLSHNKSTFIWTRVTMLEYVQFPWRFYSVAIFCLALGSGVIIHFFEKQKILIALVVVFTTILLNYSFFREDIWYSVSDSYFTTGEEWNRQRTASIHDYWPKFGHVVPSSPSDGEYINYFPGWVGATPNSEGLIPSSGTKFINTPVRLVGNIISLMSVAIIGVILVKKKIWKEKV